MKMEAGLFWGILLVVLGASLIFKVIFNIQLPIFRIILAFVLIYFGFRVLFGNINRDENKNDIIFSEARVNNLNNQNREYNVIFGKGTFDFTNIEFNGNQPQPIELNTVFGNSVVRLNKDIPVKVKGETVFANLKFPNGNSSFFGETTFLSNKFDESRPYIYIKVSAVFGSVEFNNY